MMIEPNMQQVRRPTEESKEILITLDQIRDRPLAVRAALLARIAFALEKRMYNQMPTEMRRKMGKLSLYGALYQPENLDFHQERAEREGITRREAKARNFVELYGGEPSVG